jgi:hypothetical protein
MSKDSGICFFCIGENMHRIELVAETQPFFHIPGKLHLTWEAPGPVDIDLSIFTEQEKNWLRNGKLKNALKITNLNPEAEKEVISQPASAVNMQTDNPVATLPISKVQLAEQIKVKAEEDRKAREISAKKTLSAPAPALSRFIEKCGDPLQLRTMKEEEELGKNRTKVLKQLDSRIASLSSNVASIVGAPLDDSFIQKEANLPEIEEESIGSVTIKMGAED